jgi:hypothetical protein
MKKYNTLIAPSLLFLAILSSFNANSAPDGAPQPDRIFISSSIGEPLKAVVFFEAASAGSVQMAPASEYKNRGLGLPDLDSLQFDFKHDGVRPFIKISSIKPYDTPAKTLLFSVQKADGSRVIEEYSLILELPGQSTLPMTIETSLSPSAPAQVISSPIPAQSMTSPAPASLQSNVGTATMQSAVKPTSTIATSDITSFNKKIALINKRLTKLEAGHEMLLQRFAETDVKINSLIDRFENKQKPATTAPTASPTAQTGSTTTPMAASVKPKTDTPNTMAEPVKAQKTDTEKSAQPTLTPVVAAAVPAQTASSPAVAASSASPAAVASAPVASASSPVKKRVIVAAPPPPPPPTFIESLLDDPVTLYGGGGTILAAIGFLAFFLFKKFKKPADVPSSTVFGQNS